MQLHILNKPIEKGLHFLKIGISSYLLLKIFYINYSERKHVSCLGISAYAERCTSGEKGRPPKGAVSVMLDNSGFIKNAFRGCTKAKASYSAQLGGDEIGIHSHGSEVALY